MRRGYASHSDWSNYCATLDVTVIQHRREQLLRAHPSLTGDGTPWRRLSLGCSVERPLLRIVLPLALNGRLPRSTRRPAIGRFREGLPGRRLSPAPPRGWPDRAWTVGRAGQVGGVSHVNPERDHGHDAREADSRVKTCAPAFGPLLPVDHRLLLQRLRQSGPRTIAIGGMLLDLPACKAPTLSFIDEVWYRASNTTTMFLNGISVASSLTDNLAITILI